MEAVVSPFLFYLTAAVTLFSGVAMVASRNLFHSALFMLLSFLGVAGLYASMHENFMAIVQILVYVGAITILVIFGIMLTNSHGVRQCTNPFTQRIAGGLGVAMLLCFFLSLAIRTVDAVPIPSLQVPTAAAIGLGLFGVHIMATELAAILLLVAMIGAVMISRKGDEEK